MVANLDIRALVESKSTDIEGLLGGSGLTLERFKATVFQLWDRDQALRECTPNSVLAAVMAVADIGLTFTPALGHAYLVKYGNSATPIIGYKGLMHLALRSGGALDFRAGVRHRNDTWRFRPLNPTEPIEHEPAEDRGPVVGYYAVAYLPGRLVRAEYMTKQEVEQHRDRYSKAYKNTGKWGFGSFDDMAMKTVVRKSCKFLRISGSLEKAVTLVDTVDEDTGEVLGAEPDTLPQDSSAICAQRGTHAWRGDNNLVCSDCGAPTPIQPEEVIETQGSDAVNAAPNRYPRRSLELKPQTAKVKAPKPAPDRTLNDAEQAELIHEAKRCGLSITAFTKFLFQGFDVEDPAELKLSQVSAVMRALGEQEGQAS